jgi:hypothetical protein
VNTEGVTLSAEDELKEEIDALRNELESLRQLRETDREDILREIALDRQRIARLEHPDDQDPTPTELAHLQRIEKHLRDSSRHAASFAEIRGILGVSPGRVSQLVRKLDPQKFEIKRSSADHKARILVLKRRLSF